MCGIIGCVGHTGSTVTALMEGVSSLEYRGYDSVGVALGDADSDELTTVKRAGKLTNLRDAIDDLERLPTGDVGVGHTRWSTHGPPTDENAHPHTDADDRVAVVHNGIVENYQPLRDELEAGGVTFTSDTDTEVIPHLVRQYLDEGDDPEAAFRRAVADLEGSYAVVCVVEGTQRVFGTRQDSPLVLGVGDDAYYLASDVPAFLEHTRRVVYLDDGEFVVVSPGGWTVRDGDGERRERQVETVEWTPEQTGKSGYEHFMLKEIQEQPDALRQSLTGRVDDVSDEVTLPDVAGDEFGTPNEVHLIACGTSYHAALYGASLLQSEGVPADAYLASEYATSPAPIASDTLVIGVTQSGETADTLSALRAAGARGAHRLAVTNVVGSTAARECESALYIRAGPEIGVAATKTFSSQLLTLNLLARELSSGRQSVDHEYVRALRSLPDDVQSVLDTTAAEDVVEKLFGAESFFFIGRGFQCPVALEGALKFKEITYEHAEGFAAGELKHGPLALVTGETPVFAVVIGDDERAQRTVGNMKEVEARDAPVVAVTDGASDASRYAEHVLSVPDTHPQLAPVLANIQLQLVSYHMAARLGRSIDKPRNLAKSVTVE